MTKLKFQTNMKTQVLFLLIAFSISTVVHAHWYFETSMVDSKFSDYTATIQTSDGDDAYINGLESYGRFRDFSYELGFLTSLSSLQKRVSNEFKAQLFRLSLGLAFDKLLLNTKTTITNNSSFNNKYNFSQLQGSLGIHFTPYYILKSKNLYNGSNQAMVTFDFNASMGYNIYTSSIQE